MNNQNENLFNNTENNFSGKEKVENESNKIPEPPQTPTNHCPEPVNSSNSLGAPQVNNIVPELNADKPSVAPQSQAVRPISAPSPAYSQPPNHVYPYQQTYSAYSSGANNDSSVKQETAKPKEKKNRTWLKVTAGFLAGAVIAGGFGSATSYYLATKGADIQGSTVAEPNDLPASSDPLTYSNLASPSTVVSEVVKKTASSVVEVTTESKTTNPFFGEYVQSGAGSGVVISNDGYIVTNNHVVDSATSVKIRLSDGTEYPATLVGRDDQTDLAVLKIEASGLVPATFGDSDNLTVGDLAIVIGNPLGTLGGTVTEGIVSALNREIPLDGQTMNLIQTSAAVNPGNSGGGLFDANGNLVGVVNAKSSGSGIEGLGFAIPSNLAKTVINQIIDNGYVTGRPQLGISILTVSDTDTAMYHNIQKAGLYVAEVSRENGLVVGDRLVTMDSTELVAYENIKDILGTKKAGDIVKIGIERDGKQLTVEVELVEKVPDYMSEFSKGAA